MLYPHVFDKISSKFRGITWISWLHALAKYQKPCYYELRHLHYANWRLKLASGDYISPVGRQKPEDFFNVEPWKFSPIKMF